MVTGSSSRQVDRARGHLLTVVISLIVVMALSVTSMPAGAETAPWQSPLLDDDDGWEDATQLNTAYGGYDPKEYSGSMYWVTQEVTGAERYWNRGYTGRGIDVALIDSGVVEVEGLDSRRKITYGPDLSFESQADNLRHLDTYGHGTHIAGIIAGEDRSRSGDDDDDDDDDEGRRRSWEFVGMAPDAGLVSLKVADSQGAVDVTQVIAAIDWVVQHHDDDGLNIRVINLSYGTDGQQPYQVDPLTHAVERAWDAGIVVVVAAGNDGNASPLRNPAYDPFVIAVGASEANWTYSAHDDTIPEFSSCGTPDRHVDIVAPGKSIVSLRNPGSHADQSAPEAVVGDRFFLGSGTSQAAAVVSGAVALILDRHPDMTPDEVKALLMETAQPINDVSEMCQGAGLIDLYEAYEVKTADGQQSFVAATGTGLLELARGTNHVIDGGVALTGEQDIMGNSWSGYCFGEAAEGCALTLWNGGSFNGAVWTGNSWSGNSWSGNSWSGGSWSGNSWSGNSWSNRTWSGNSWGGNSWGGNSWSGGSWSGGSWSGSSWSGLSWR